MKKKYLYITALVTLLLAACQYKDFEDGEYAKTKKVPVVLHFDWSNVDSISTKMQVMFYNENMTTYERFDVGNRDTTVYIAPGIYHVTSWNNDATHVYFNGYDKRDSINATSPLFNPQGNKGLLQLFDSLFPQRQIYDYPDYMVHANKTSVMLDEYQNNHVTLVPDSMVVTVDLNIHGVRGLGVIKKIRGVITNVAGKRYMTYPNKATMPSIVIFDARGNEADSTVNAKFWVFGLKPEDLAAEKHEAALFFWANAGSAFFKWDITDAIKNFDAKRLSMNFNIDIDIRDYLHQTGLDINVEEWNNENISIGL